MLRRVEIIDTNLEIPDNDSTTVNSNTNALMDKSAAGEVIIYILENQFLKFMTDF